MNTVGKLSHSLKVSGTINRKKLQLLVDSGAVISVMSRDCAIELGIPMHADKDLRLMGADGIHLIVLGSTAVIPLLIEGETFTLRFVIVEELVASAILGSNFLISNKITLDFEVMVLKTKTRNIPLISQKMKDDIIILHVAEDTYITNHQDVNCEL